MEEALLEVEDAVGGTGEAHRCILPARPVLRSVGGVRKNTGKKYKGIHIYKLT